MTNDFEQRRLNAIHDGEIALECLESALEELQGAQMWGFVDMFTDEDDIFSDLFKHSGMDEASGYIEEAKAALMRFSTELGQMEEFENIDLSTFDFWGLADWFWDSLIADWVVQDRIEEACEQIESAIEKVKMVLNKLKYGNQPY